MFLRCGGAPPNVNFVDWYIEVILLSKDLFLEERKIRRELPFAGGGWAGV
jgi:hypothetical protein